MVPTSHLSTISFYFILRSTDVWVSTHLASSILLAISALYFHREPSAGTHGIFVFVFIRNQVLEPTALLSLLSYQESSAGTHSVIVFAFISGTKCWNSRRYCLCSRSSFQGTLRAAARVTSEMKGFFASDGRNRQSLQKNCL